MFNSLIIAADPTAGDDRASRVAASLARRAGLTIEVMSVAVDDVAAAIVDHVRGRDGALLVMATRGAVLVSEERHSVTGEVLAGLVQPVLLLGPAVPHEVSPTAPTLIVAIDRTHAPPLAASVIDSWQRTFGGHRPYVVDIVAPTGWPAGQIDDAIEREHADEAAELLAARGIDAAPMVLRGGDPVSALLQFAEGVEDPVIAAMSDRWPGGPSHWYSTTRRLVQQSPRPVLVIPRDLAVR